MALKYHHTAGSTKWKKTHSGTPCQNRFVIKILVEEAGLHEVWLTFRERERNTKRERDDEAVKESNIIDFQSIFVAQSYPIIVVYIMVLG